MTRMDTRGSREGWESLVDMMLELGSVTEGTSRYGDKPALFLQGREIAHVDAGGIDLRVTAAGWRSLSEECRADPAVVRDPRRRDWIELVLTGGDADVRRVSTIIRTAHRYNCAA